MENNLFASVKDIFHERTWLKASIHDVEVSRLRLLP